MRKKIIITPYNPLWPEMFQREASAVRDALGQNLVAVHHVGSTSVPGLAAKAKIDIIAEVKDRTQVITTLEAIEYEYRGEFNIPFHMGFAKRDEGLPINLHLFEEGNPEIELNLMFRNYLRSHPEDRDQYGNLKIDLAQQEELHHRVQGRFSGYNLGKDKFIKSTLKKAGFQGILFQFCTHHNEWKAARHFRQAYFFDKVPIQDPYTWTFKHDEHIHFILYKGTDIAGYAHIQLWPNHRAALRIIVIDEPYRNQGLGEQFLEFCEKWLKENDIKKLHTESSPHACAFYMRHHYSEMPFDDPAGEPTHPQDIALGKVLYSY